MTANFKPVDSTSVFDISLQYASYAKGIKNNLFQKALQIVETWDMNQPSWKLSREAKKLAEKIFKEYSENLHEVFNQPDYMYWLEGSINAEKSAFLHDLLKGINSKIPDQD